jgi:hypothetical protein
MIGTVAIDWATFRREGFVVHEGHLADIDRAKAEMLASPYTFCASLLGTMPWLIEVQPIRPVQGGRSIASTSGFARLHTDSQLCLGIPASLQVLFCVQAASQGGESTLVDFFALLRELDAQAPLLARDVFERDVQQAFYFGDVAGPTLALRGGALAVSHAPMRSDPVGIALREHIERARVSQIALRPGQALVASNHRMLHGRMSFDGPRELLRLLVWLPDVEPGPQDLVPRARVAAPAVAPDALARFGLVQSLVRGEPPAKLAARSGLTEAALYALRDAFLQGGLPRLASA